jgi:hypothetical protein
VNPWGAPEGIVGWHLLDHINLLLGGGIFGLPASDRLFHFQNNLKLCRCHRMTVSGLMTSSVSFQEPKTLVMVLKKNLSEDRSRGLEDVRASISSCFRRKMISS